MNRFIGKIAPPFNTLGVFGNGQSFFNVNSEDYKGKWLVLFFYSLNFTEKSTLELRKLNEIFTNSIINNVEILAVSTDSEHSHKAWINSSLGKLNFNLISDRTLDICSNYGLLIEGEGVSLRGMFIIDTEQIIRYSCIHDNQVTVNINEIFRVLEILQGTKKENTTEPIPEFVNSSISFKMDNVLKRNSNSKNINLNTQNHNDKIIEDEQTKINLTEENITKPKNDLDFIEQNIADFYDVIDKNIKEPEEDSKSNKKKREKEEMFCF